MNCANKDCRCQETVVEEAGRQYCSERCAQANVSAEGTEGCGCGHPDCAAI